jgi:hypothetical protein
MVNLSALTRAVKKHELAVPGKLSPQQLPDHDLPRRQREQPREPSLSVTAGQCLPRQGRGLEGLLDQVVCRVLIHVGQRARIGMQAGRRLPEQLGDLSGGFPR